MELKPTFRFAPETAPPPTAPTYPPRPNVNPAPPARPPGQSSLGPLAILLKPNDQDAQWKGQGLNFIWRPHFGGGQDHFLMLSQTDETLEMSGIAGPIPNRGLLQTDINMFGIHYLNQISDAVVTVPDPVSGVPVGAGLHFEPGILAIVPPTSDPNEPQTVVRMAAIPHGTSIVAQGTISAQPLVGKPAIGATNITPFQAGNPAQQFPFPAESTLANNSSFTTVANQRPGITQAHVDNPNSFLSDALAKLNVAETTVIEMSTTDTPVPGGGTSNTAFLSGLAGATPGSFPNPNALAATAFSTVWIMKTQEPPNDFWLFYSQTVLLKFNELSWPHVTVGTLKLQ